VAITDDVKGALARMKPRVALYVGGMGHRDKNFHKDIGIAGLTISTDQPEAMELTAGLTRATQTL